ncbi:MAG: hypothetical protein U0835_19495 [Isosphaeraceae bacterium]
MPERPRTQRLLDPHLPGAHGSPYARLSARLAEAGRPGVGPSSTTAEVRDVFFAVMRVGPTHEDREAWDALRDPARRLALDFLHYEFASAVEDALDAAAWDLPVPEQFPDVMRLGEVAPDFSRIPPLEVPGPPGSAREAGDAP